MGKKPFSQLPSRRKKVNNLHIREWPDGEEGQWRRRSLCTHCVKVWRMEKPPLTSAGLGFYPPSSKFQRHGSLHQQATAAQWLFSGWQLPQGTCVSITSDHSLLHTKSLSLQGCLLDLHSSLYVWGFKSMLQNPTLLSQSHGLQWAGWRLSLNSEYLLISTRHPLTQQYKWGKSVNF